MLHKGEKMKCKFIITRMGKIGLKDIAYGDFYIISADKLLRKFEVQSGGYGNGPLEEGEYVLDWFTTPDEMAKRPWKAELKGPEDKRPTKDAYTLFNIGWFFHIEPLFRTDRKDLGLHPDGGCGTDKRAGYVGSLGCPVFPFKDADENEDCYALLSGGMALYKTIPLYVERVLSREAA